MTDVDTSASAPPPPPAEPGAAFPPPAPGPVPEADDRVGKMLALIALVSLGVALITTVLWLGDRDDGDDTLASDNPAAVDGAAPADANPSEAQQELDAAQARVAELEAEVAALAASMRTDDQLTADVRAAESELATAEARLAEVEAALEASTASNARLDEELATANARIAELEAGGSDPDAAPSDTDTSDTSDADTSETPAPDATPADVADAPEFARWVGELLSSRTGSSRLGADAATCFGAAVIDQIGLDALGAGQNNAASGASRQVVINAMVAAADSCGIAQGLIFG